MKLQKLAKSFLGMSLAATMLAGCTGNGGGTGTTPAATNEAPANIANADAGSAAGTAEAATDPAPANGAKVGVSMPTKDLQRWNQDGANMESQLKAAGYEVELQYAAKW